MDQWWTNYLERKKRKDEKKKIKEERKKKKYLSIEDGLNDDGKLELLDSLLGSIVDEPEIDETEIDDEYIKNGNKLEILDLGEAKPVRGKRKERYSEYSDSLKSTGLLDSIKKSLETEESIIVRTYDIAQNLGKVFVNKDHTSIYWGLKYVLFNEGIVCEERVHKSDVGRMGKLLYMRNRRHKDSLPPSLENIRKREKNKKHGKYDKINSDVKIENE